MSLVSRVEPATNPDGNTSALKVDAQGNLLIATSPTGTANVSISSATGDAITSTDVVGKESLDVNVTNITLSHLDDSIALGNGTGYFSSTQNSTKLALDVTPIALEEKTIIDEADANTTYIGVAPIGTSVASALWKIKKLSVSGTQTTVTYADGDTTYDNIWNNRSALTYL